jgi:hypothetical protein
MKVDQLPGNVNLTYCTNIHAGESWPDIRASLDAHVPAIKAAVAPGRPLGIGLRLSGEAAAVAQQPEQLEAFREQPPAYARDGGWRSHDFVAGDFPTIAN